MSKNYLTVTDHLAVPLNEIEFQAIRAQGHGGQNVNKVASAIQLKFDVRASSLPGALKERVLNMADRRISKEGVIVIKAQQFRQQDQNRADALLRLAELLAKAAVVRKKRIATRPSPGARRRRIQAKKRRADVKALRGKVRGEQ